MSLESNIADLNTSTAGLLAAINTQKAALDTAVASTTASAAAATASAASAAATLTVTPSGTGTQSRTLADFTDDFKTMFHWLSPAQKSQVRARGTTLDLSSAMQLAIDDAEANGGGTIIMPRGLYNCNVILKQGVALVSFHPGFGYLPNNVSGVTMKSAGNGFVVDTPAGAIGVCGLSGINFLGLGASIPGGGVRLQNVSWGFFKGLGFRSFADQALRKDLGVGCTIEDVLALESLLNRTRTAKCGVIEVNGGTDDFLNRIEANAFLTGAVTDSNLRVCGIKYAGANAFLQNLVGEFSDIGIHIDGLLNRMVNCRGDTNVGHGWEVIGYLNQFGVCYSQNNSRAGANLYDQYNVSGLNNKFTNSNASTQSGPQPRYGFNDLVNGESGKNNYLDCTSTGAITANYKNDPYAGSSFTFRDGPSVRIATGVTAPSVEALTRITLNNATPTAITDFTGSVNGQVIEVYAIDSRTSVGGANFAASTKLQAGNTYRFYRDGATWRLDNLKNSDLMGADVGDAAKVLTVGTDEPTQLFNSPISTGRYITLSTSVAKSGDKFKVVRTAAATGASVLDLNSLKAIAVSQWAEATFSGSAWVLTGFGSL